MKDLYTFDTDLSGAKSTYAEVTQAYENFFKDLGVPFLRVQGDSGDIGKRHRVLVLPS